MLPPILHATVVDLMSYINFCIETLHKNKKICKSIYIYYYTDCLVCVNTGWKYKLCSSDSPKLLLHLCQIFLICIVFGGSDIYPTLFLKSTSNVEYKYFRTYQAILEQNKYSYLGSQDRIK